MNYELIRFSERKVPIENTFFGLSGCVSSAGPARQCLLASQLKQRLFYFSWSKNRSSLSFFFFDNVPGRLAGVYTVFTLFSPFSAIFFSFSSQSRFRYVNLPVCSPHHVLVPDMEKCWSRNWSQNELFSAGNTRPQRRTWDVVWRWRHVFYEGDVFIERKITFKMDFFFIC